MADLNIRNFPEEYLRKLKVVAAGRGVTLRDLVLDAVQMVLNPPLVRVPDIPPVTGDSYRPIPKQKHGQRVEVGERTNGLTGIRQMVAEANGLCEHGRDAVTCLECDWVRRQKK